MHLNYDCRCSVDDEHNTDEGTSEEETEEEMQYGYALYTCTNRNCYYSGKKWRDLNNLRKEDLCPHAQLYCNGCKRFIECLECESSFYLREGEGYAWVGCKCGKRYDYIISDYNRVVD